MDIFSSILFLPTDTGSLNSGQAKKWFSALNDTFSMKFMGHPLIKSLFKYYPTSINVWTELIFFHIVPSNRHRKPKGWQSKIFIFSLKWHIFCAIFGTPCESKIFSNTGQYRWIDDKNKGFSIQVPQKFTVSLISDLEKWHKKM